MPECILTYRGANGVVHSAGCDPENVNLMTYLLTNLGYKVEDDPPMIYKSPRT